MTRSTVGLLVSGVVGGMLLVAGCGSADQPGAATTSGGGSASASATATASAKPSPSSEATPRAKAATSKALLPTAAFAKIGLDVADKPTTDKWDWFETCRPSLPSESRQVIGTNGKWEKDGLVVSQTVVAYPDQVAENIVAEVAKTVTCATYSANGHEYSKVKAVDLPKVAPADAKHAWCMAEAKEDVTICHSVIAAQDLISSLWVMSGDADEAKSGLAALTLLAAKRIQAQVR